MVRVTIDNYETLYLMKVKCPYQLSSSTIQPGNFERKHDKFMCSPRLFRMNVRRINTKRRKGQSKQIKYLDFLLIWIIWNINNSKNITSITIFRYQINSRILIDMKRINLFVAEDKEYSFKLFVIQHFFRHTSLLIKFIF